MSVAYAEQKPKDMRKWCQRPGRKDAEGNNVYLTQQNHKRECDVNYIVQKYDRTGLITHVQQMEARYGDVSGADFRTAQDLYLNATQMFDNLPAEIKKYFSQSPAEFLEFMEDPDNREKAIELGLISKDTDADMDGLGEHITADDYKKAETEKPEKTVKAVEK